MDGVKTPRKTPRRTSRRKTSRRKEHRKEHGFLEFLKEQNKEFGGMLFSLGTIGAGKLIELLVDRYKTRQNRFNDEEKTRKKSEALRKEMTRLKILLDPSHRPILDNVERTHARADLEKANEAYKLI